jgi:ribosomal protein L32
MTSQTLRWEIEKILDRIKGTIHEANELRADDILFTVIKALPKTKRNHHICLHCRQLINCSETYRYRQEVINSFGDSPHRKI